MSGNLHISNPPNNKIVFIFPSHSGLSDHIEESLNIFRGMHYTKLCASKLLNSIYTAAYEVKKQF